MHQRGETWLGSDTVSHYAHLRFPVSAKWVFGDGFALGCAGDGRAIDLLRAQVDEIGGDNHEVATQVREVLKADGFERAVEATRDTPLNFGQGIVLARPDGVAIIDTQFSLLSGIWGLAAEGSGEALAYGVAHALRGRPAEEIVRAAVEAAIELDTGCGGEAWVQRLPVSVRRAA